MIFKFWKEKIVQGGQVWQIRRLRKDGNLLRLQKVSHNMCLVSGCIIMQKSDIRKSCFGAATFVVVLQFSQNAFIELACDRSAFWHWDLNSWTLISEKNSIQNLLYGSYSFGNTWVSGIFSGSYSVGNLPLWFKIIHPGLITSDYIIKSLFTIFWVHFEKFFAIVTRIFYCSSVNKWGIHLAFIFLTFRCFFKIASFSCCCPALN